MKCLNFISKTAGVLGAAAIALEANNIGVRRAKMHSKEAVADQYIAETIGSSKTNTVSPKNAAMKDEILKWSFPSTIASFFGGIGGYFSGFARGIANNWAQTGFAALSFFAKHKPVKIIGMAGLGISIAWDLIKNGTNIFERKDYLK